MTLATNNPPTALARRFYLAGCFGGVFIGSLHTYVHLKELAGDDLKARFDEFGTIAVSGTMTPAWDLFQALSLLMGVFALTLGLVNIAALMAAANRRPPIGVCAINIAMLIFVIAMGVLYLGPTQIYGGIGGIIAFGVPIVSQLRPIREGRE